MKTMKIRIPMQMYKKILKVSKDYECTITEIFKKSINTAYKLGYESKSVVEMKNLYSLHFAKKEKSQVVTVELRNYQLIDPDIIRAVVWYRIKDMIEVVDKFVPDEKENYIVESTE